MDQPRCPGQDMRYWKPEDIFEVNCPWCEADIEFWKDEPVRVCHGCGREIRNPKVDPQCAKWCRFASDCVGEGALDIAGDTTLEHRLIVEMRNAVGQDRPLVDRAAELLEYAERIRQAEGGDALVVTAAALLLDVGVRKGRANDRSTAGDRQHSEGPRVARAILEKLRVPDPAIEHVCRIVDARRRSVEIETQEFRIVSDARWLVEMSHERATMARDAVAATLERVLRTRAGRELAEEKFLRG